MPKTVSVPALQPLVYEGRSYVRGEMVRMRPIDAAAYARAGRVTLHRGALVARDPEPEPVPSRRRYRRRDMTADPE